MGNAGTGFSDALLKSIPAAYTDNVLRAEILVLGKKTNNIRGNCIWSKGWNGEESPDLEVFLQGDVDYIVQVSARAGCGFKGLGPGAWGLPVTWQVWWW